MAKLNAHGFSYTSIKLISSVLSGRRYRTKINSAYSDWEDLLIGVSQGSVLGPLLFNIYMCDLFLFITESSIANYANDTTLYEWETNLLEAQTKIETESLKVCEWFRNKYLKANSTKSHVVLTKDNTVQVNVGGNIISNEKTVKLLRS